MSIPEKTLINASGNRFIQSVQESPHGGAAAVLVLLLCLIPFLPDKAYSETLVEYPTYKGVKVPVKVGNMADTVDTVAWKVLAIDGKGSQEELRADAEYELKREGKIPRFHRIEVAGILATDYGDTPEERELFDKRIKFSSLNQVRAEPLGYKLLDRALDFVHDFTNTGKSENGETTPYIKQLFAVLKGASVDEIVAHSAGSEAVYAAILNGVIYPPKRLIIIGVPDENREKWRLLQDWAGIEVHVVGFETDNMRRGGELLKSVSRSITEKPLPNDTAALSELWHNRYDACLNGKSQFCNTVPRTKTITSFTLDLLSPRRGRNQFDYNIHANPPADDDNILPRKWVQALRPIGGHDRVQYYKYLYKTEILTTTIGDLKKQDYQLIGEYSDRELAEAMQTARGLIDRAQQIAQTGKDPDDSRGYCVGAYGLPCIPEVKPPQIPVAVLPDNWRSFRLLTAKDVLDIVKRACDNPGSVTDGELDNSIWECNDDTDHYRPGLGEGLTGCPLSLWQMFEHIRQRNDGAMVTLDANGINNAAKRLVAWYAPRPAPQPRGDNPPQGGSNNYDLPSRDRGERDHSIDLSHAKEVVRRLQSPF